MPKKRRQSYPFKLSFCMMVKDEENNLPRCLESIRPVIERNDVELIIVDTGSSDRSVEIAKRYTDKVYFHQWNNHFSEMRNITISYAQGEWIFILDADEELVDQQPFLQLLDSKSLNKFNAVQFLLHNHVLKSGDRIVITPLIRMFRNDGTFAFTGTIHEQPRFNVPVLATTIKFNHYGYINDDAELMERKFLRTATLLKQELAKDPTNIYYQYQLARSYGMHGDHQEAYETIKKAYALNDEEKKKSRLYKNVVVNYASMGLKVKQYEEVISICREGLRHFPEQIDLYFYLGLATLNINRHNEALDAFLKYLDLYDRFNTLQTYPDEIYTFDDQSHQYALRHVARLYYTDEQYSKALKYSDKLPLDQRDPHIVVGACIKLKQYDQITRYYDELDSEVLKNKVIALVEREREQLSLDESDKLASAFAQLTDTYALFNKIRIAEDGQEQTQLIQQFLKENDFDRLPLFYTEVVKYLVVQQQQAVITALKKWKPNFLRKAVHYLCLSHEEVKQFLLNYLQTAHIRPTDFHANRLYTAIALVLLLVEAELAKKDNRPIANAYDQIFMKYLDCGVNLVRLLYQMDRIRMIYKTLDNQEHQLFILMHFVREMMEKGNMKRGIQYYREAVELAPEFAAYFERYLGEIYVKLAQGYHQKGCYADAVILYEEALKNIEDKSRQEEIVHLINKIKYDQSDKAMNTVL